MKLKHYLVYLITNTVNGKIYVGKHETFDPDDDYMGSGNLLKRAQVKYGLDKFTKTILADFDEPWSMSNMEATIVDEEFVKRKDTYNITVGGTGGFWYVNNNRDKVGMCGFAWFYKYASEEQKTILLEHIKLTYSRHTKEQKKEISESISRGLKKHYAEHGHSWTNRRHTEETKDKQRQTFAAIKHQQGEKNSRYGTHWWTNPATGESHSFHDDEVPIGWIRGRGKKHRGCNT